MRHLTSIICLCAAVVFLLKPPAFAQDAPSPTRSDPAKPMNVDEVRQLQQTIAVQQRQLDAQQAQLEAQQARLRKLQQQVQEMVAGAAPTTIATVEKTAAPLPGKAAPRRTDTQSTKRDQAHPHDDWKGSFAVNGLDTRFKIGGFAELDVIHDTDAIASKGQFVTATIATRNAAKTAGADGQTSFSVNPTRLYFETRTPVEQGRLTTFLSMDFFGNAMGVQPDPRMRQAYGELSNILFGGDLLAGQAWSTFADLEAFPNVLDFQGPNSFFGTRQPLVRWTKGVADGLKLMVAAESPDNHIIEGADTLTAWPDGVLTLVWDEADFHLMGSLVARDLRASFNNGPTRTVFGWGSSLSGRWQIPIAAQKDSLTFSVTYGEGVGSDFNDQPADAVFDSAGAGLAALPVFGYFASYEHWWSPQFNSTVVYGALEADNQTVQAPDAFKETQYASGNLVWLPMERWLLGVEGLWGRREDKDGADGTDFRTQFTSRFTF